MAHFTIENLGFSYPGASGKALDKVTLSIEQGSYVALCGKSGCGKTTLLYHLKSVLTPHGFGEGRVLFCGKELSEVPLRVQSAQIGFVMQNPEAQIVTDKVWHELAFGLESIGTEQHIMRLRVAEMASYFGIQTWFHKDVRSLSGGEKQLLNLASIMVMQPSVLVLDEPCAQLDPMAAADFLGMVGKINRDLGTTVIIAEQRLEDVLIATDQMVVMDKGRVLAQGNPRTVGEKLYRQKSDMLAALPTPMRTYFAVSDKMKVQQGASDICDEACKDAAYGVPLTVREGRKWLSHTVEDRPSVTAVLPEKKPLMSNAGTCAIEFVDVWQRYERNLPDVLRGVSLSVQQGCIHAIVGANGVGKSSLLKVATGLLRPYRGTVRIENKPLKAWKSAELFHGCLAMLPQDPQNLFVKDTVCEDLDEMLDSKNLSSDERMCLVTEIANSMDITSVLDAHPFDLSGGEQQRVALAKVLLTGPRILLLDEPTKGIDAFFKRKLAQTLRELQAEGMTIVMVSHDVEFCARCADVVSMLFDGEMVLTETPRKFFSKSSFFTTAASRMSRQVFENAITDEDVIALCVQQR